MVEGADAPTKYVIDPITTFITEMYSTVGYTCALDYNVGCDDCNSDFTATFDGASMTLSVAAAVKPNADFTN